VEEHPVDTANATRAIAFSCFHPNKAVNSSGHRVFAADLTFLILRNYPVARRLLQRYKRAGLAHHTAMPLLSSTL
jgi:hypothetical protein